MVKVHVDLTWKLQDASQTLVVDVEGTPEEIAQLSSDAEQIGKLLALIGFPASDSMSAAEQAADAAQLRGVGDTLEAAKTGLEKLEG